MPEDELTSSTTLGDVTSGSVTPAVATVSIDDGLVVLDDYVPMTISYSSNRKTMSSLREMYKVGTGPSSSHTMGPRKAAQHFMLTHGINELLMAGGRVFFKVTLYSLLAKSGVGYLTDKAILTVLDPESTEFVWLPNKKLPVHPKALTIQAYKSAEDRDKDVVMYEETYYSVGGGSLRLGDGSFPIWPANSDGCNATPGVVNITPPTAPLYSSFTRFSKIRKYCLDNRRSLLDFVWEQEGCELRQYLANIWTVMKNAVETGLPKTEPVEASGDLHYPRKAYYYKKQADQISSESIKKNPHLASVRKEKYILSYAIAVSQENASATTEIVTAPTACSSGIIPGVFYYYWKHYDIPEEELVNALAIAGIIGNIAKCYGSVSGAEAGCQAETGVATAMAAAGCTYLLNYMNKRDDPSSAIDPVLLVKSIEYAAVMALKHNLGLTCDPVRDLVVIPCIERNGNVALFADGCAEAAILGFNDELISWDEVVHTMVVTGKSLNEKYKDTAQGGLAVNYALDEVEEGATVEGD